MDSNFDSVILAGGFGTRLSPITDSLPKPMLPIFGESAFSRNLKALRKCGFNHTAVTTMYLAEKIEETKFDSGTVEYFRETSPLGSAGAVGSIKHRAQDCLLVVSGDAVWDFDLKKAKDDFLKSGCDAAIVLCRTKDSGEYGSVCLCNGKITRFCEKPSPRDTVSDLINTGIYFLKKSVLDLIPDNTKTDFAKDLFPIMMRKGLAIAGLEPMGHWFDIGTFGEYHRCNMWFSKGENCIGKRVSIHPSARIEHSVILDNCTVGNSVLKGCIIGENVVIGNDCIIPPGCVIGPGAELRDGTAIPPATVVQTGSTLIGDSYIDIFDKQKNTLVFDDDSIIATSEDDGYFVRLGRILGSGQPIIAFAEGKGVTLQQACEIACGAAESGSECTVISGGNSALAAFAAREYRHTTAFIFAEQGETKIKLFSSGGMPLSREELRKLKSKASQKSSIAGSVYLLPHGALIKRYLSFLKEHAVIPSKIGVSSDEESRYLAEIAEELEIASKDSGVVFSLSDSGERAKAILGDGTEISYWQLLTICCILGKQKGVILPNDTPSTVERILRHHSIDVAFYGDNDSDLRRLAETDCLHRDGIMLCLTATGLAQKNRTTLRELAKKLPPFSVITRLVFAERDKMNSIISKLHDENLGSRTACFDFGDGKVNVYASASGRFRLIAEAVDFETAEEISLRAADMLEKRSQEK